MLLWEALDLSPRKPVGSPSGPSTPTVRTVRLPYEKRCAALAKSGTRCRGKIRPGSEFCLFHDPAMASKRKERLAAGAKKRSRLSHLPDGYLRKLTTTAAVGNAMDRLYREVRLGIVTPEMGRVLFGILTRVLDSGLVSSGPRPDRSKAARMRPKLERLLTREDIESWNAAVARAERVQTTQKTVAPVEKPAAAERPQADPVRRQPAALPPPLKVAVSA